MKKHKGSIFEYEDARNKDLLRAYRKQIAIQFQSKEPISQEKVFQSIAKMPAKRFWVSEERAAIVVSSMMKGDTLEEMGWTRREMYKEIHRRVVELMRRNPDASLNKLITIVCNQPAPKFYLTPKTIKVTIYKIKRQWYEERRQKLRHSP